MCCTFPPFEQRLVVLIAMKKEQKWTVDHFAFTLMFILLRHRQIIRIYTINFIQTFLEVWFNTTSDSSV